MPMHDWTRVRAGTYHFFHQRWIAALADALNTGGLPAGYFAMSEQRVGGPEADMLTLERPAGTSAREGESGGVAVQTARPHARFVFETDIANYARRADRLTVRHDEGEVVAVIELVPPGNKDSRHAIRSFVEKAAQFLEAGIHLLVVDPFPPSRRDPHGIHKAIWDEIRDEPFELPPDKPLTVASYEAGAKTTAFIDPIAVGDLLPDMPLFLAPGRHVPCPLEATYQTTWSVFPAALKGQLENSGP